MSNGMEVLYRSVWKNDSKMPVRVYPLLPGSLYFCSLLDLCSVLGMNPLQELRPCGTHFLRVIAINAKNLLRPEQSTGTHVPGPTPRVAEPLRFGQVCFASLQLQGISAELFFLRFAFLNIETRSIPLDDVAVCIAKWHLPVEHPAVFPIRTTDASFVLEDLSSREAGSPLGHNPLNVLRVNESRPIPAGHFVQSDAQVFQPTSIEVIEVTVGPGCVNQRRNRVDQELSMQTLGSLS